MIEPSMSPDFPAARIIERWRFKVRKLARQCRHTYGRRELLQLAAVFDRRADHFDSRAL